MFRNIIYLLLFLNVVFVKAEENYDYTFSSNQDSEVLTEVRKSNIGCKSPENDLNNLLLLEMKKLEGNVDIKMADMDLSIHALLESTKTVNLRLDNLCSRIEILSYKLNDLTKETKDMKNDILTNLIMEIKINSLEQNKISEAIQHIKQGMLDRKNVTANNDDKCMREVTINKKHHSKQNKDGSCASHASPFCDIIVPNSIQAAADNLSIWQFEENPAKDELDRFLERETGCEYISRGILPHRVYELAKSSIYNSTHWELRFAVRAEKGVEIRLKWSTTMDYSFGIGYEENEVTNLYKSDGWVLENSLSTPNILSQEQYTPFYFRVGGRILTFGKLCDTCSPTLVRNISIHTGTTITMHFYPWTSYGAKFLVCPVIQ